MSVLGAKRLVRLPRSDGLGVRIRGDSALDEGRLAWSVGSLCRGLLRPRSPWLSGRRCGPGRLWW